MSETRPIRKPPSRTSLPTVRSAPLAMSTLSSLVGTNGSPRLAVYARNTAISSTSTVTAPIRIGFAKAERVLRRIARSRVQEVAEELLGRRVARRRRRGWLLGSPGDSPRRGGGRVLSRRGGRRLGSGGRHRQLARRGPRTLLARGRASGVGDAGLRIGGIGFVDARLVGPKPGVALAVARPELLQAQRDC